jgi:hypothetical protein
VVSHALDPLPTKTERLIVAVWVKLPPLCPGSTAMVLPRSGPRPPAATGGAVVAVSPVVDGCLGGVSAVMLGTGSGAPVVAGKGLVVVERATAAWAR